MSLFLALFELALSPAYVDLKAGSPVLASLRERTVSALARETGCNALRARVVIALHDNVVFPAPYPEDSMTEVDDKGVVFHAIPLTVSHASS